MVLVASYALAQTAAVPDPLVKENATVKLAAHTYVIPDGNVGLVPNVGIIVGSREHSSSIRGSGGATARPCCARSRR